MPDSKRKQLWDAIKAKLGTLVDVEDAHITEVYFGVAPLGKGNVIAIIPSIDEFNRMHTVHGDSAEHTLNFTLRYVVNKDEESALLEYETAAPLITAKMAEDKKWGALARDTIFQGERWMYPDAQHSDTGVDLNYQIHYGS